MAFPAAFSAWGYRAKLTFESAYVGAGGVTNFPFVIPWTTAPAGLFTNANADGSDIRLTASDGETEINFELVTFTPGSSLMEIWVLGASLASATDTDFYIYWGNAAATAKPAAWGNGVWTTPGYNAVWHLEEDAATYAGAALYADATGNGNTGADYVSSTTKTGRIGKGQGFDGTDDYIGVTPVTANSSTAYAMSFWFNAAKNEKDRMVARDPDKLAVVLSIVSGSALQCWLNLGGSVRRLDIPDVNWNAGAWNHLIVTAIGTTAGGDGKIHVYLNGVHFESAEVEGVLSAGIPEFIGASDASTRFYDSLLDEVRCGYFQPSQAWATTEYNNQIAPANTVIWGDVEAGGAISVTVYRVLAKAVTKEISL